jgi:hypothetical protein
MSHRPSTIGAHLEHDRLHHRALRLQAVTAALRRLVEAPRAAPGLALSLDHFERELAAVRHRMRASR